MGYCVGTVGMSQELTITPTSLDDLANILADMLGHINMRNAAGWEPFQNDETWEYHLGEEIGSSIISCPICKGFRELDKFNGAGIQAAFKSRKWMTPLHSITPNVHAD